METYHAQPWISLVLSVIMTVTMVINSLDLILVSAKNQEPGLVFSLYVSWFNVAHWLHQKMDSLLVPGTTCFSKIDKC